MKLFRIPIGEANKDPIEAEANTFAANLLVPFHMLKDYLHLPDKELANKFGVSETVIRYRRHDIKHSET